MKKFRLLGLATVLFSLSVNLCMAQDNLTEEQIILQKHPDIVSINNSINYLVSQIQEKDTELSKETNENRQVKLEEEIKQLNSKLKLTRKVFTNTISDVNFFSEEDEDAPKIIEPKDLMKELQELLMPFLESFKNATKAPRKIEKLKVSIENIDSQNATAKEALENIALAESMEQFKDMKENLETSKKMILKAIEENNLLRNMYKRDLDKVQKGKTTLFAVADSVNKFFSTKGRNLIICIAVIFIVAFLLKYLKKVFLSLKIFSRKSRYAKTFNALYGIFIWVASILAAMLSLYLLNDWFLFSLSLIILALIIWSMKVFIPKFITELKLIMDLGYIKEKERIVWQECPWIVKKLAIKVQLENEYLDTKIRTLPIREIADLYSRPLAENEPLFPSRTGDYVMLSDDTYGKVIAQTYENVILESPPTKMINLPMAEYLSLKPKSYSSGFKVSVKFYLDYKYHNELGQKLKTICSDLFEMLTSNTLFKKEYFNSVSVFNTEFGDYSIDFDIVVDCKGELAPQYKMLKNEVMLILLEITEKRDWFMHKRSFYVEDL